MQLESIQLYKESALKSSVFKHNSLYVFSTGRAGQGQVYSVSFYDDSRQYEYVKEEAGRIFLRYLINGQMTRIPAFFYFFLVAVGPLCSILRGVSATTGPWSFPWPSYTTFGSSYFVSHLPNYQSTRSPSGSVSTTSWTWYISWILSSTSEQDISRQVCIQLSKKTSFNVFAVLSTPWGDHYA